MLYILYCIEKTLKKKNYILILNVAYEYHKLSHHPFTVGSRKNLPETPSRDCQVSACAAWAGNGRNSSGCSAGQGLKHHEVKG